MFTLNPDSSTPLVSQIVDGFRRMVGEQALKPGAKVPSIRAFAASHGVSVFTVVEAYDRLVAQGWLVSRANAGFFVKRRSRSAMTSGCTAFWPARSSSRRKARRPDGKVSPSARIWLIQPVEAHMESIGLF